jgi:hypothetical protein
MSTELVEERLNALRKSHGALQDEVESINRKKANRDEAIAINDKLSMVESDSRTKFASLNGRIDELGNAINRLADSVDHLSESLDKTKKKVAAKGDDDDASLTGVPRRIPVWMWVLVAIGIFASLQLGLDRFAELQGVKAVMH